MRGTVAAEVLANIVQLSVRTNIRKRGKYVFRKLLTIIRARTLGRKRDGTARAVQRRIIRHVYVSEESGRTPPYLVGQTRSVGPIPAIFCGRIGGDRKTRHLPIRTD